MSKENLSPASLELQPISIPEIHHQFKQEHPAGFRLKYRRVRWGRFRCELPLPAAGTGDPLQ